ncbi:MAG TPA: DUF6152 family protein [Steroidobacteraceae bacterium]|nr:DUF6152 family protein [Steroidobacteraceae bacterium]
MRTIKSAQFAAVLATSLAIGIVPVPAFAHHSFGHYAMEKVVEIEGTVNKFEWSNPHCWLFVDVASADGAPVTYGLELQSVGEMLRRGWKKTIVKYGDKVKIKFRPMRDGTPGGLLVSAEKDGKMLGEIPDAPPTTR